MIMKTPNINEIAAELDLFNKVLDYHYTVEQTAASIIIKDKDSNKLLEVRKSDGVISQWIYY